MIVIALYFFFYELILIFCFFYIEIDGSCRHDGGDGMFIDKVLFPVGIKNDSEVVKPFH